MAEFVEWWVAVWGVGLRVEYESVIYEESITQVRTRNLRESYRDQLYYLIFNLQCTTKEAGDDSFSFTHRPDAAPYSRGVHHLNQ